MKCVDTECVRKPTESQWGVHSIKKIQHTEWSDWWFSKRTELMDRQERSQMKN